MYAIHVYDVLKPLLPPLQATWSVSTRQGSIAVRVSDVLYPSIARAPAANQHQGFEPVPTKTTFATLQSHARQAVAEYVKVAEKYGMTPSELALAWCDSCWFVASTIIGATSLEQLKVQFAQTPQYMPIMSPV